MKFLRFTLECSQNVEDLRPENMEKMKKDIQECLDDLQKMVKSSSSFGDANLKAFNDLKKDLNDELKRIEDSIFSLNKDRTEIENRIQCLIDHFNKISTVNR